MKYTLLLYVVIAVSAANVINDSTAGYKDRDRFFYFPGDGDGVLHLVDSQEAVKQEFIDYYARNPNNNAYWLFTRGNPDQHQVLHFNDVDSLYNSHFDTSKVTVFLVHGWKSNGNNNKNRRLREAFLQDDDVNIIVLDWNRLANSNYVTAANGVPAVGRALGQFINWLVSLGASYDQIHLVGFSLGGRLIRNAEWETGGKIKRITVPAENITKDPTAGYKKGDRFFYFPGDGDHTLHLVDSQEQVDKEFIENYARNSKHNAYWLFTRDNPDIQQVLQFKDAYSVLNSNFDTSKVTVFLVHGWNGNGNNGMNRLLREAFLQKDDVNVIVLDWSCLSKRDYVTAVNGVPAAGRALGRFINWLVSLGASYDRMHLVGFSLGAHLVGNAGLKTGSRVRRITGLDPAGPLWYNNKDRLTKNDAQYVEVIHTNKNFLGYTKPCGDADFYPNGGHSMPGCFFNTCSHSKSYDYMAATVINDHLYANQCDGVLDATWDRCQGDFYPMGNSDLHKNQYGIFRVNTGKSYPY